MVVTDIVNHSREFSRHFRLTYFFGFIGVGAALNVYHVYGALIDELVKRLAVTYPPFMLVLTYMFAISWMKFVGLATLCAITMMLITFVATRQSPTPFYVAYFGQLRASLKNMMHLYLFCLILGTMDATVSLLLSAFSDTSVVSILTHSNQSTSVAGLLSLICLRWFECWTVFVTLFCFFRRPDARRLHVSGFAVRCLVMMKTKLVPDGCWYYSLLFGSLDYIDRLFHIDLTWYLAPLCMSYIVSMFLLANGLFFESEKST